MKIAVRERRWRANLDDRRNERIKWDILIEEGKRREYKEETRRWMEMERKKWDALTEVMVESASKVCREIGGIVANPWMIGHEVEVEEMRSEISEGG